MKVLVYTFALQFALCYAPLHAADAPAPKPNIVLILADDLGYGDLSCQGHPDYKTPHIDRLAGEGIRLTQFTVAAPLCSPSRAAILTGKFPARFGIISALYSPTNKQIGQPDWLDPRALTLPRLLQENGFNTAIRGKWHLVEEREAGTGDAPQPPAYGFMSWELMRGPWNGKLKPVESFDSAIQYLREKPKNPFFLEITAHEPHVPYIASEEALAANLHLDERSRKYAASVTDLDRGVGRVLDALREMNLDKNTLVIFTSDNGAAKGTDDPNAPYGQYYNRGSNGILRGWKGDLYEGGIREPFIARWPGRIPAGKVDSDSVVSGVDLLPTLATAAGVKTDDQGDGENRLAVLEGKASPRSKPLFWRTVRQLAVREGDWKLVTNLDGSQPELFDLAADVKESRNLAADRPEETARLSKALRDWFDTLPRQVDPACCSKMW
jgi:N-acetylgalactosamine-6-sulfatase